MNISSIPHLDLFSMSQKYGVFSGRGCLLLKQIFDNRFNADIFEFMTPGVGKCHHRKRKIVLKAVFLHFVNALRLKIRSF